MIVDVGAYSHFCPLLGTPTQYNNDILKGTEGVVNFDKFYFQIHKVVLIY